MKLKTYFGIGFLCLLLMGCGEKQETVIRFLASDYTGFQPIISILGEGEKVNMDAQTATGSIVLSIDRPVYAEIQLEKYEKNVVYLEPGAQLEIAYSCKRGEKYMNVSGDLQKENETLHGKHYGKIAGKIALNDIKAYLVQADSLRDENRKVLERLPLSKDFKRLEAVRIGIGGNMRLVNTTPYKDADIYVEELRSRMEENPDWLVIPEYCDFMKRAVERLATLRNPGHMDEMREMKSVPYILDSIRQPELKAYLLDVNIMRILSGGIAGNEKYVEIYRQYCTSPQCVAKMDAICKKFEKTMPGYPCPDFRLKDLEGKEYTLADFKGKFVYIDLWATWCGPCKALMPALLELEEQFEGTDMVFVSISVDRNKDIELWKKTVAELGLGGIQLHLGENWDWVKNFMPNSLTVPRFILLDREGKIINSSMSRPDDTATAAKFNELLGK